MNRCRRLTGSIFLALVLGFFVSQGVMPAQSATPPLQPGATLPDIVGQNLLGSPAHLSTATTGKIAAVVFSFSKAGGKDTELWNRELLRDFGSNRSVALSTVIMLESAPRLLRGVILSGIKNGIPTSLHGSTIVSYKDEKLWKQRLAIANDNHAYVLLLGQDGRIRGMSSGGFSEAKYDELKTKIQEQFQFANPRELQ